MTTSRKQWSTYCVRFFYNCTFLTLPPTAFSSRSELRPTSLWTLSGGASIFA
jgi:hypothetical protein